MLPFLQCAPPSPLPPSAVLLSAAAMPPKLLFPQTSGPPGCCNACSQDCRGVGWLTSLVSCGACRISVLVSCVVLYLTLLFGAHKKMKDELGFQGEGIWPLPYWVSLAYSVGAGSPGFHWGFPRPQEPSPLTPSPCPPPLPLHPPSPPTPSSFQEKLCAPHAAVSTMHLQAWLVWHCGCGCGGQRFNSFWLHGF